jgi:hypothetical protein
MDEGARLRVEVEGQEAIILRLGQRILPELAIFGGIRMNCALLLFIIRSFCFGSGFLVQG